MKKLKYEILIILFFVLSRLPSMGHDNFTTDTWKWKSRSYDFGSGIFGLDFEKTLQKYHPGVTLMWIGTAGIKVYNASYSLINKVDPPDNSVTTIFGLDFVQKFFLALIIGVGLAFIFYPLKIIFDTKTGLLAVFLISFEPYFISLTRVFHLEGLLSVFMLVSVVWLYWYITNGGIRKLIASAFFAGLAILTKTTALFLLPFTLLMLTAGSFTNPGIVGDVVGAFSKNIKSMLILKNISSKFILWLVTTSVVIFTLWPALWVDAAGVYKAIYKGIAVVGIEREHIQYYFGNLVEDPGSTFYPVVLLFKSSPWFLFGLICLIFIINKLNDEKKKFILFLFCYSILYLIMLTLPTKKLDRYIMPSMVSLVVISSFFYVWLWDRVRIKSIFKMIVFSLPILILTVLMHPDYLTYYNPVTGGLKNGIKVLEPKWLIGENEILKYFEKVQKDENYKKSSDTSIEGLIQEKEIDRVLVVALQEKYYTQIWPFFREIGAWAVIEDISAQSKYAQFFVYPVWDDTSVQETRFTLEYEDSIFIRGVEVYKIYRRV